MSVQTSLRPRAAYAHSASSARASNATLGAALISTGLLAGFFYAFAVAVMLGLDNTGDRVFVETMQEINEAVQNPVFLLAFLGAPAVTLAALIAERRRGPSPAGRWIVAALVLCVLGLMVTFAFNIPLNDDLKAAGDPDRIANLAQVREDFENPWVAWNIVRTVLCTAALGCLGYALLLRGRSGRAEPSSGA